MKKIFTLVLTGLTYPIFAYIPFNPIIKQGGDPLRWQGKVRQGIVGWLEAPQDKHPQQQDQVLMLQTPGGWYYYIHPENPDVELPRGLFIWQSGWNFQLPDARDLKKHAAKIENFWQTKKDDLQAWLQVIPKKSFFGKHKGVFQDNTGQKFIPGNYVHPSKIVDNFFTWTKDEQRHKLVDRLYFVHAVLGVTENYFRDFFGGIPAMPSVKDITTYFPLKHKDFPQRSVIEQSVGALQIRSLKDLATSLRLKNPSQQQLGRGKIILLDGYQIYRDTGGTFPDKAEQAALAKNKNLQAKFIDSDAAHGAREATDVRGLLADLKFKDALFQDAATRYLLEGGIEQTGKLITDMLHGPVQGEEVSIATAGRSFALKYFEPVQDLLKDFFAAYHALGKKIPADPKKYQELKERIQVGWYPDVAVTSGLWRSYILPYPGQPEPDPAVHHKDRIEYLSAIGKPDFTKRIVGNIFNRMIEQPTTVNLALVTGHNIQKKTDEEAALAKILIEAAYEVTFMLAALYGKRIVVLTLVGAGAFAGPYGDEVLNWIIDTLQKPVMIDLISRWGLDVYIVNYPDLRPHRLRSKEAITAFAQRIKELSVNVEKKNKELLPPASPQQQQLISFSVELAALHKQLP